MIEIRQIRATDAAEFLELAKQTDQETAFMLIEPGERNRTVEQERERIQGMLSRENQVILVAEKDGQLVGRIVARGGDFQRNKRTVSFSIAILRCCWDQGIGTRLLTELEQWAREHKIHRLELTVSVDNTRAIHLYQKAGYEIEGTKRDALFVNGAFVNNLMMGKILD
jgi:RimJ/RimL family protein N-acetyltransferase